MCRKFPNLADQIFTSLSSLPVTTNSPALSKTIQNTGESMAIKDWKTSVRFYVPIAASVETIFHNFEISKFVILQGGFSYIMNVRLYVNKDGCA